jgi:hypothetical protein
MTKRTLYLVRPDGRLLLKPSDRQSEDLLDKVRPGRVMLCRTRTPRNGKHHRLLWAVAGLIADNNELYDDAEHVVEQLKLATGHVKRVFYNVPGLGRIEQLRGASISYEAMPQEEFSQWFDKALGYICSDMLPGVSRSEVRAEIAEALGLDYWPKGAAA